MSTAALCLQGVAISLSLIGLSIRHGCKQGYEPDESVNTAASYETRRLSELSIPVQRCCHETDLVARSDFANVS